MSMKFYALEHSHFIVSLQEEILHELDYEMDD